LLVNHRLEKLNAYSSSGEGAGAICGIFETIATRMLTEQALAAQGVDLSAGPFPADLADIARLETDPVQIQTVLSP
jgi:hypothetical protein